MPQFMAIQAQVELKERQEEAESATFVQLTSLVTRDSIESVTYFSKLSCLRFIA